MATRLSVNLNKIALLRNSRNVGVPDLCEAGLRAIRAGADGLTIHPRADGRHSLLEDAEALARLPEAVSGATELNIEGDLRPELVRLAATLKPAQFTVVPVIPGEKTSERGWRACDDAEALAAFCERLAGEVRVAAFCDPHPDSVKLAAQAAIDAVEIHTEPYARDWKDPSLRVERLEEIAAAAAAARGLGLRVHAGHDLTLENLPDLLAKIAPDEVSIGHHLTAEALYRGWETVIADYAALCHG